MSRQVRKGELYRRRCDGFVFRVENASRVSRGGFLQAVDAARIFGWYSNERIARDFIRLSTRTTPSRDFSKKELWRTIDKDQKVATKAKLAALRTKIREAIALRKGNRPGLTEFCSLERARARQRIEALAAEFRAAKATIRLDARGSCQRARRAPTVEIERLRQSLAAERKFVDDLRRIERGNRARRAGAVRTTRTERQSESDDEVRSNIPEDLVPLFNRVRGIIKATPRKSRTEAFLQYVEEHPREEYGAIEDKTDALVRELERQQRAGRRDASRHRRPKTLARRRRRL